MKKRKLAIIGFVVSILTLVFTIFMLEKRFLIFGDNISDKMKSNLKTTIQGVVTELGDIQTKLETFSSDDIIVNTLSQFEIGESIEKGVMEIQQVRNSIQFASAIKLVSLDGKVVVNTANHADEGSLLADEKQRGKLQKSKFQLQKNGEISMSVPCFTKSKRYIGKIIVNFDRKLFLTQFSGMGKKVLNRDYFIFGGAVFYNFSRDFISKNKISSVAIEILKNKKSSFSKGKLNILKSTDKRTGLVFVYGLQVSQVPLPAIAAILLILNILIAISFLVLILLYLRSDKNNLKVKVARESIDTLGKEIEENGDYADKIIAETEKMFDKQEKEIEKLKIKIQSNKNYDNVEQEISLSQVMQEAVDSREFLDSPSSDDLHSLIDKVSDYPVKGGMDKQISKSILSYYNTEKYIFELDDILKKSFYLAKYLIFEKTTSGKFSVKKQLGFEGVINHNFMINGNDQVIDRVISQKKIFFVNSNLSKNLYVSQNLKLLQLNELDQLAFLPIIHDRVVIALAMIFIEKGSTLLTMDQLYELRMLTTV